jgi:hypothetical protein
LLPVTLLGAYNFETYGNSLDGGPTTVSGPCTAQVFSSVTLSISNCTASGAGVSTSGDIQATFSALHVDSSLALSNAALPSGITASSYARTVDTINADPNVAYLGLTFHLDGTLSDSGLGSARIVLSFGFNYDDGGLPGVSAVQCSRSISSGQLTVDLDCVTPLYPIADFASPYFFSLAATETNPAPAKAPHLFRVQAMAEPCLPMPPRPNRRPCSALWQASRFAP